MHNPWQNRPEADKDCFPGLKQVPLFGLFHPRAAEFMGRFCPQGTLGRVWKGDVSNCYNQEDAIGNQRVCSGQGQSWPGAGRAPTTKNPLAPNVHSAEAEKLPGEGGGFVI